MGCRQQLSGPTLTRAILLLGDRPTAYPPGLRPMPWAGAASWALSLGLGPQSPSCVPCLGHQCSSRVSGLLPAVLPPLLHCLIRRPLAS